MCAPALSLPWIAHRVAPEGMVRLTPDTTTKTVLITGAAAGLSGTALFVLIHSLLIFPIWSTIALAIASGSAAGWLVTRRRAGVIAFAAATLALTIAMGGAIPIVNSARAALLFAGFLPICAGSGVALSAARRCLTPPEPS